MNIVLLHGRFTRDPELKTYQGKNGEGTLCNFSLAVDRPRTDDTDFFNCTVFGKRAEVINKFFSKGSEIVISGSMTSTKKDDKLYWSVTVNDFDFCGSKKQNAAEQPEAKPDSFEELDEDVPF